VFCLFAGSRFHFFVFKPFQVCFFYKLRGEGVQAFELVFEMLRMLRASKTRSKFSMICQANSFQSSTNQQKKIHFVLPWLIEQFSIFLFFLFEFLLNEKF
jgi:hypothetical protein